MSYNAVFIYMMLIQTTSTTLVDLLISCHWKVFVRPIYGNNGPTGAPNSPHTLNHAPLSNPFPFSNFIALTCLNLNFTNKVR